MEEGISCVFCRIKLKEIKAFVVYEDEKTLAFLDVHPRAPGHTMVIPKVHAPTIEDLPEGEIEGLFLSVKKMASRLNEVLHPDGLTIGINQGSASGQTVPHLHVHLLPRFSNDGGGSIHSVVGNAPKEPLEEMVTKITTT